MKRPGATKLGMNLLIGAVIVAFVVLLGFFNVTKPRILVLHSAAQDSPWVQQVDRGMREALKQNRRPVSVEWNYLGLGAPAFPRSPEPGPRRNNCGDNDGTDTNADNGGKRALVCYRFNTEIFCFVNAKQHDDEQKQNHNCAGVHNDLNCCQKVRVV